MTEMKTKIVLPFTLEYDNNEVIIKAHGYEIGRLAVKWDGVRFSMSASDMPVSVINTALGFLHECLAVEKAKAERAARESLNKFTVFDPHWSGYANISR